MKLSDLPPRSDPKGGAKTPTRGIPRTEYEQYITGTQTREEFAVSLREYFESMLNGLEKRIEQAFENSKEAISVATQANERRLNLLNEFRGQSEDESKKYALKESVELLRTQVNRLYGGVIAVGVIGIANLVKLFFGH